MTKRIALTSGCCLRLILALVPLTALVAPAAAQEPRIPSVEEILRKLTTPQINPDSLRNDAVQVEGRRAPTQPSPSSRSIDLAVNFEYASAKLTPDARIVLDNLGQALSDAALRNSRISIAGHTDARGGDAYNLALSMQRARSVAEYLTRQYRISAQRLTVEGYGRKQLLDPANPQSAANRRVQVTNLGP